MKGRENDSCTVQAEAELEATVEDGESIDSTLCTVLDSVVSVLQGPVSVNGIQSTVFKGSTNDSCEQMSLSKSSSTSLESGSSSNNGKVFTWWVITLMIVAILFVLLTCFMTVRRPKKRNATQQESYDEVEKNEPEENEVDIPPHIKLSRVGTGSQAYSTINVQHCQSCSTQSSDDDLSFVNSKKRNYRK